MRIQLLSPAFPPEITGSGNLYYDLARDLVAAGHQVTVIVAQPRQRLGEQKLAEHYNKRWIVREQMDGIDVVRPAAVPMPLTNPIAKGLDHVLLAVVYLIAGLRAERADVVMAYSPPLPLGAAAWVLARRSRARFVFNVQDIFPQYAIDVGVLRNKFVIRMFRSLERFLYKRAQCITVHSEGNRDYLASHGAAAEKLHVIHNWTDTKTLRPDGKGPDLRAELGLSDRFVVLYAGTLGWAQGLDVVLDAAERLVNDPEIVFLIAGDGPRRASLVERASRNGLQNVRFLPLQQQERYGALLRAADIGLISLNPRITTPVVPGKLSDILACGRPVIASVPLDGDAAQIIRDSRAGVCVTPDNGDEFAAAIRDLKANPARAAEMRTHARQHALAFFSRARCTAEYDRLFRNLAGDTRYRSQPIHEQLLG